MAKEKDSKKEETQEVQKETQDVADATTEVNVEPADAETVEASEVAEESSEELAEESAEVSEPASEPVVMTSFDDEVTSESNEEPADAAEPVTVQPIKFNAFDEGNQKHGEINKNLDILMDIKLQLTVELGRTELPIKKVLELTRGSIIELEKVAGEPVELYANGKLIAHGEVVVIEDNFGLRITTITEPEDRLKGL